jgi:hypothetical protein
VGAPDIVWVAEKLSPSMVVYAISDFDYPVKPITLFVNRTQHEMLVGKRSESIP